MPDCNECPSNAKKSDKSKKNKKIKKTRPIELDCCELDEEEPVKKCPPIKKCPPKLERPSKPIIKPDPCKCQLQKVLSRIQPPVQDRAHYLKLRQIKEMMDDAAAADVITIYKPSVCPKNDHLPENFGDGKVKKKGKKPGKKGKKARSKVKSEKKEDQKEGENEDEEKTKEDEEKAKEKEAKDRERREKDKFWCAHKEVEKEVTPHWTAPPYIRKCDTVCSFDSRIDLAGLGLTKEDKTKIEENLRRLHPPQNTKSTKSTKKKTENNDEEENEDGHRLSEEEEERRKSDPLHT